MVLAQDPVGPYTIALAVVLLIGLPVAGKFLRRAVRLEAGPLKAELGEVKQHVVAGVAKADEAASKAEDVRESIGAANGHGSLQDQLAAIARKAEADDEARAEGQHRQAQIAEAVATIQNMVITMRQLLDTHSRWQVTHGEEDLATFLALDAKIAHLNGLLGEPAEGMKDEPLIPYMHEAVHRLRNEQMRGMLSTQQAQVLVEAVALIREMRDRLDGTPAEKPVDEDTDPET